MLFAPPSSEEFRKRVFDRVETDEISAEDAWRQLLREDPYDGIALIGLARERARAGDPNAEDYLWQSIEADPCASTAYLELARIYFARPETTALAEGLAELGMARLAHEDRGALLKPDFGRVLKGKLLKEVEKLPVSDQYRLIRQSLDEKRSSEPEDVTVRLRYLRLIQQVQQDENPDEGSVDRIIAAGEPMVPLLAGVVRAWLRDRLPDEEEPAVENALALLGEIAPVSMLPSLLELVDLEDDSASGASGWAVGRMLERDPEGWEQVVTPLIPNMDVARRMAVMLSAHKRPALPVSERVTEALANNIASLSKIDLEVFFPVFVMSGIASMPARGLALARRALGTAGRLLSKENRRHCEQIIAALSDGNLPPALEASEEFTVYQICRGEAEWPGEDDEPEDDEEEDDFVPAPVVRKPRPGRNEPCWCGSGKKYKKCHLDADSGQDAGVVPEGEFDALRRRIGEFLRRVDKREAAEAVDSFPNSGEGEGSSEDLAVTDWLIHDWIPGSFGTTVLRAFLARHGSSLSAVEREAAEAWARSHVGLYEVQRIEPGKGIVVKDLLRDGTFAVHDVSLSKSLALWDWMFARIVPGERGTEVTGAGLLVPRHSVETMLAWLRQDRRRKKLEWPEYLKENWPRIRRKTFRLADEWRESLQLANSDGEELLFSKAVYRIEGESPLPALQAHPDLEENDDDTFVWLNEKRTVLGNIAVDAGRLTVECNSKPRLERARGMIENLAGASLRHLGDEYKTLKQLQKEHANEPPSEPEQDAIPDDLKREAESEMLRAHYADWVDRSLPALAGRTPREAMKTVRGRREVEELLKSIENGEQRKKLDGRGFYEVGQIRAALGMGSSGE